MGWYCRMKSRIDRTRGKALRAACVCAVTSMVVILGAHPPRLPAQALDRIVSEHVRIRVPAEQEWLGRDVIVDLERCYLFVHRLTGKSLPRWVLVTVNWSEGETRLDRENAQITLGMRGAAADSRAYLMHHAAREMGRLALLVLSEGNAGLVENRFLLEGMAEIIAHEFEGSSRGLGAAWARCHLLDRMQPLSFEALASWDRFSAGRQDLASASPGITLLLTGRSLRGRERLLRLFEAMRNKSPTESLAEAFKLPASALQKMWLERVRGYRPEEKLTVASEEAAPALDRVAVEPDAAKAGTTLRIRAFIRDRSNDLAPEGVFLEDRPSQRVVQAATAIEAAAKHFVFELPLERERKPGLYEFLVTAIDEAGNLRTWPGSYAVVAD